MLDGGEQRILFNMRGLSLQAYGAGEKEPGGNKFVEMRRQQWNRLPAQVEGCTQNTRFVSKDVFALKEGGACASRWREIYGCELGNTWRFLFLGSRRGGFGLSELWLVAVLCRQ